MWVYSNFLVSQLRVANFAISVVSNNQISRLELIILQLSVKLLNLGQVVLNLTVFLISELVIENRAQETNQIAVIRLKRPIFWDNLQDLQWFKLVPGLFALHELDSVLLKVHAVSLTPRGLVLIKVDRQQLSQLLMRLSKRKRLLILLVPHIELDSLLWLTRLHKHLDILLSEPGILSNLLLQRLRIIVRLRAQEVLKDLLHSFDSLGTRISLRLKGPHLLWILSVEGVNQL